VGEKVGALVGASVTGAFETVGFPVGLIGDFEGFPVGLIEIEGFRVGIAVGFKLGLFVGAYVGDTITPSQQQAL